MEESDAIIGDYRFLPSGAIEEIWIRDMSVPVKESCHDGTRCVISTYLDISDLKGNRFNRRGMKEGMIATVVDGLMHEIQNNLQVIRMAADLLVLNGSSRADFGPVIGAIERCAGVLEDAREYLSPLN